MENYNKKQMEEKFKLSSYIKDLERIEKSLEKTSKTFSPISKGSFVRHSGISSPVSKTNVLRDRFQSGNNQYSKIGEKVHRNSMSRMDKNINYHSIDNAKRNSLKNPSQEISSLAKNEQIPMKYLEDIQESFISKNGGQSSLGTQAEGSDKIVLEIYGFDSKAEDEQVTVKGKYYDRKMNKEKNEHQNREIEVSKKFSEEVEPSKKLPKEFWTKESQEFRNCDTNVIYDARRYDTQGRKTFEKIYEKEMKNGKSEEFPNANKIDSRNQDKNKELFRKPWKEIEDENKNTKERSIRNSINNNGHEKIDSQSLKNKFLKEKEKLNGVEKEKILVSEGKPENMKKLPQKVKEVTWSRRQSANDGTVNVDFVNEQREEKPTIVFENTKMMNFDDEQNDKNLMFLDSEAVTEKLLFNLKQRDRIYKKILSRVSLKSPSKTEDVVQKFEEMWERYKAYHNFFKKMGIMKK